MANMSADYHPYVHNLLAGDALPPSPFGSESGATDIMPDHHTNLSTLIRNPSAHPLPSGHPAIDPWIGYNTTMPPYTPYRFAHVFPRAHACAPSR
jgi:hypothetical protein